MIVSTLLFYILFFLHIRKVLEKKLVSKVHYLIQAKTKSTTGRR